MKIGDFSGDLGNFNVSSDGNAIFAEFTSDNGGRSGFDASIIYGK